VYAYYDEDPKKKPEIRNDHVNMGHVSEPEEESGDNQDLSILRPVEYSSEEGSKDITIEIDDLEESGEPNKQAVLENVEGADKGTTKGNTRKKVPFIENVSGLEHGNSEYEDVSTEEYVSNDEGQAKQNSNEEKEVKRSTTETTDNEDGTESVPKEAFLQKTSNEGTVNEPMGGTDCSEVPHQCFLLAVKCILPGVASMCPLTCRTCPRKDGFEEVDRGTCGVYWIPIHGCKTAQGQNNCISPWKPFSWHADFACHCRCVGDKSTWGTCNADYRFPRCVSTYNNCQNGATAHYGWNPIDGCTCTCQVP